MTRTRTVWPSLALLCTTLCTLFLAEASLAQPWPNRTIHIIVGFVPGGGTDVTARLVAPRLAEQLKVPVVVDNKPGAEARIATEMVARAAPDGYTLLAGAGGQMVFNPGLFAPLPYDHARAFAPITLFNADPLVFAVHPSVPATSIAELIALARARPGQLFHASGASAFHVAEAQFNRQAGVQITHVPYKGAAPAVTAAVSGEASLIVMSIPPLLTQLRAGRLRPLAITGSKRSRLLPDTPTIVETGLDFEGISWSGLFAPAGTPGAVVERLHGALKAVLDEPGLRERFDAMGQDTTGMGMSPAEFEVFFQKELTRWTRVITELGIRGE